LSKDKIDNVREAAEESIELIKVGGRGYKYLLSTQKPLFATPYTKELADRIKKLQEIVQELKNEFSDKFIGITVFGSTSKGYFLGGDPKSHFLGSDLDWGIFAKDRKVSREFQNMAKKKSLQLCHEHYTKISRDGKISGNKDVLFYGLFFGDYEKLRELQRIAIQNMNKGEWDDVRLGIAIYETSLYKAAERFDITEEELKKIDLFAILLRVPPPYDETIKIIERRVK